MQEVRPLEVQDSVIDADVATRLLPIFFSSSFFSAYPKIFEGLTEDIKNAAYETLSSSTQRSNANKSVFDLEVSIVFLQTDSSLYFLLSKRCDTLGDYKLDDDRLETAPVNT